MADETAPLPGLTPETPASPPETPAVEPTLEDFVAETDAAAEAPPATPATDAPAPVAPEATEPAKTEEPPVAAADEAKKARAIIAAARRAERAAKAKPASITEADIEAFKASPSKLLGRLGLSLDEFLLKVTEEGEPAAAPKAEDRIGALEKLIADQKLATEEAEAARFVETRKAEIAAAVTADAAKYPYINRGKAHNLVHELMIEHFERHKTPLDQNKAAAEVEAYLASLAAPAPVAQAPKAAQAPAPRAAAPTLAALPSRSVAPESDGLSLLDEDARFLAVLKQLDQLQ